MDAIAQLSLSYENFQSTWETLEERQQRKNCPLKDGSRKGIKIHSQWALKLLSLSTRRLLFPHLGTVYVRWLKGSRKGLWKCNGCKKGDSCSCLSPHRASLKSSDLPMWTVLLETVFVPHFPVELILHYSLPQKGIRLQDREHKTCTSYCKTKRGSDIMHVCLHCANKAH